MKIIPNLQQLANLPGVSKGAGAGAGPGAGAAGVFDSFLQQAMGVVNGVESGGSGASMQGEFVKALADMMHVELADVANQSSSELANIPQMNMPVNDFFIPQAMPFPPVQGVEPVAMVADEPVKAAGAWDSLVEKSAEMFGLDPKLIHAVIEVESGGKPDAQSPVGAQGLMQLMPATAKELGVNDSFKPAENIEAGSRYLKKLLDRYDGDRDMALAAYNWGMGNLERKTPAAMPSETRNYIEKVSKLMDGMG